MVNLILNLLLALAAIVAILDYFNIKPKRELWGIARPLSRNWKLWLMLLLVIASIGMSVYAWYSSSFLGQAQKPDLPEFDEPSAGLIVGYGHDSPESCYEVVNGKPLLARQSGYKLAIGCFAYDAKEDVLDAPYVQFSNLYDIKDIVVTMRCSYQKYFIDYSERMHSVGIMVALLNVPNGVQPNQFSTLRQARTSGVKIIQISMAKGAP